MKTLFIILLVGYILIAIGYYALVMYLLDHTLQQDDESINNDDILNDRSLYEKFKSIVRRNGLEKTLLYVIVVSLFAALVWPLFVMITIRENKNN